MKPSPNKDRPQTNKQISIIGINAYHADASAAIFVNGKLVAAIEEERFTRIKHWAGFPEQSIKFCLKEAGLSFKDVNYFAIGRNPGAKIFHKLKYLLANPTLSFSAITNRLINSRKAATIVDELSKISGLSKNIFENKIKNIEHHHSHIASAFFASPFKEAACLSIDGSGDFSTTMLGVGKENNISISESINFPHSLGIFYTAFTQLLGFPNYGDEYKVMGMAPYGKPVFLEQFKKIVLLKDDGLFKLNLDYFIKATSGIISYKNNHIPIVSPLYSGLMIKEFGKPRQKDEPLQQFHKDLASSVQKMTELVIFHVLNNLHKKTGLTNLCLAGGVAQNSVANGKITSNTPFKNVYIPSAAHDTGISVGAALYVQHQILHMHRQEINSAFTGSSFTNEEIIKILEAKEISYTKLNDEALTDAVTNCLINGGVVGWLCGKGEFGPRALGGRSILADPRNPNAKEIINTKIKRRESFRPFAPSILKEYVADYFENFESSPDHGQWSINGGLLSVDNGLLSSFMEKVLPIKKEKQLEIPAVTHVDGTGRLQTVDKNISPKYYALIDAFRKKTGVPILLNTSFNENEPIVNTPDQALNCYLRTDMDMLVMENIVVSRNKG